MTRLRYPRAGDAGLGSDKESTAGRTVDTKNMQASPFVSSHSKCESEIK